MHDTDLDRLPPISVETEMCALGAAIIDDGALTLLRTSVDREAFSQSDHRIIFDMLCDLSDRGKAFDVVILREELIRRQLLDDVGGSGYLGQLLNAVPSSAHIVHYASILREKHVLRQLIALSNTTLRRCYAPVGSEDPAGAICESVIAELSRISGGSKSGSYQRIGEIAREVLAQLKQGGVEMIKTGFAALDDQTGGVGIGEMVILAARPSMGKSTLIRQIAIRSAMARTPVALISLEESSLKIARNLLSSELRIENTRLRRGSLTTGEWDRVAEGVERFGELPLYVAQHARTIAEIRAMVSLLVMRHGVKLVLIDHLGKVRSDGRTAYERASANSAGMADLIKDTGVAGIVACQLNRGVTGRDEKRPSMADLRDSGRIEEDADGILLLHREDYYRVTDPARQHEALDNIAELIGAKWRDSERGFVQRLHSEMAFQRFDDLAEDSGQLLEAFA